MAAIVENVVFQHCENVCALWWQRQYAIGEPHYTFSDLAHLDNRVEANIDGLRIAGVHGLPIVQEHVAADDEGAYFTSAILALERGDKTGFLELVESVGNFRDELYSALAWVQPEQLKNIAQTLLESEIPDSNIIGLRACVAHGKHPGDHLRKLLDHSDSSVRIAALDAGARCGGKAFGRLVYAMAESDSDEETLAVARALAFCGQKSTAVLSLKRLALSDSPVAASATDLLMMADDPASSVQALKQLDSRESRARDVVRGFGLLGDPVALDWLIDKTETPELSRLAGESISMITGVDLALLDLELVDTPPEFKDGGITDNPEDKNVALDEDESLPWPDTGRLRDWNLSNSYSAGKLLLLGLDKTVSNNLRQVLQQGYQRQRNAASTQLAIMHPDSILLDTRLPSNKQKSWS